MAFSLNCWDREALGYVNTPPYSPKSNVMAESFVKSFKRNYAYQYEPRTTAAVLEYVV